MVSRAALLERARLLLAVLAFAMGLAGVAPAMAGILATAASAGLGDWCVAAGSAVHSAAGEVAANADGPAAPSGQHDHVQCPQCGFSGTPMAPAPDLPTVARLTGQGESAWCLDALSLADGLAGAHARGPPPQV